MTTKPIMKWYMPLLSLAMGLAFGVAFWIGGDPQSGLVSLGIMTALGGLILIGGRSEMIRGLRGDGRDEYWMGIDNRATLFAGNVTILAILAMAGWEWAHGRSGSPYAQLGALTGVAYLLGLVMARLRS